MMLFLKNLLIDLNLIILAIFSPIFNIMDGLYWRTKRVNMEFDIKNPNLFIN